jgi:transcriptional regulator with XRE-family HTH domain
MNKEPSINEIFSEARETFEYALEGAILQFTNRIAAVMKRDGISKHQLAEKMGCSPPYITKIFRGNPNLTLASMVKMAAAVDCEVEVVVRSTTRGKSRGEQAGQKPAKKGKSRYTEGQDITEDIELAKDGASLILAEGDAKSRKKGKFSG